MLHILRLFRNTLYLLLPLHWEDNEMPRMHRALAYSLEEKTSSDSVNELDHSAVRADPSHGTEKCWLTLYIIIDKENAYYV